ncbi:MAG: cob(I)yrinic acid a,c-diamide adenosyltransferase [Dehalococcoidales bacterium]|nr:cob(I)yrinic acid a,c-diamide adenosyltransferase [Dehalococcoidales bacterium]
MAEILLTDSSPLTAGSPPKSLERGLVQIFTGDGKGKTSAAVGAVVRALGQGLRVCVVVFMKGNRPSGEWIFLSRIPQVKIARFGLGILTTRSNAKPEEKEQAKQALAAAREAMLSGNYDLVVLDEVNIATGRQLVELDEVVKLIQDKPPGVELILTGRKADSQLIQLADLVTECLKVKHPYDEGIKARRGIEY